MLIDPFLPWRCNEVVQMQITDYGGQRRQMAEVVSLRHLEAKVETEAISGQVLGKVAAA
jgi:hypothetical protein